MFIFSSVPFITIHYPPPSIFMKLKMVAIYFFPRDHVFKKCLLQSEKKKPKTKKTAERSHRLFGADLGENLKQGLRVSTVYTGQAASLALGDHFLWPLHAGEGQVKPQRDRRERG